MTSLHRGSGELAQIERELTRMATLCGVELEQPGVMEAIFGQDPRICRISNRMAWTKLRGLLILHHHAIARHTGGGCPTLANG